MFFKALDNGKYRYYEKYYDEMEGKWKQVSITLTSKTRAAQSEARRLLQEKIDKKNNQVAVSPHLKVNDVIDEWLAIRRVEVRESTYSVQLFIVKQFLVEFGENKLEAIKPMMIQKYLMAQACSEGYRRHRKVLIALFFSYCVKVGYILENPVDSVVLPKVKKSIEVVRKKQNKFLSKEEMKVYLESLDHYDGNPRLRLLTEFMYLTGVRSGEALALKWEDVDLSAKKISINKTLHVRQRVTDYYVTPPKTLAGYREIAISSRVVEILLAYRELETSAEGFVFVFNGHPTSIVTLNSYLSRTFNKTSLEKSRLFRMTSHVLRHSHISLLVELGIPIKMIMDRVGHEDEKTTIKIYTHVTETMKDQVVEKLEGIYN